jgi:hypothetical protein
MITRGIGFFFLQKKTLLLLLLCLFTIPLHMKSQALFLSFQGYEVILDKFQSFFFLFSKIKIISC